jgi:hypothetical protein
MVSNAIHSLIQSRTARAFRCNTATMRMIFSEAGLRG